MNVSKIIAMIDAGEAPELTADPPQPAAFRARVNLENITQTVQRPVIVQQAVEITTSLAKINGGACTLADIKAARDAIQARPLQTDLEARAQRVLASIQSGEITTLQQVKDAFIL
jgi:hypothetical protein